MKKPFRWRVSDKAVSRYGEDVARWIDAMFDGIYERHEWNFHRLRVAWEEDEEAVLRYKRNREYPCCPMFDTKYTYPDGRVFLFGCHYGHTYEHANQCWKNSPVEG